MTPILSIFWSKKEKWDEEKNNMENSVNLIYCQFNVVCWKSNQTLAFSVRNILLTQLSNLSLERKTVC